MEYLIFSDSHGNAANMKLALSRQLHAPDGIFFLGDGLRDTDVLTDTEGKQSFLYRVAGNCDWFSSAYVPSEGLTALGGHIVLFTHGHTFFVKEGTSTLLAHAASRGADIVLFGHTHKPLEETIPAGTRVGESVLARPMHLFNPGSIGYNGSFGVLTLLGDTVLLSHGKI